MRFAREVRGRDRDRSRDRFLSDVHPLPATITTTITTFVEGVVFGTWVKIMRSFRGIPVCICLALFLAACSSAQTVAPVNDQTNELKRTAHQLRISADRLKSARAALKEAMNLARHNTDPYTISRLAQDWVRIDKASSLAALETLYGWLRTTARAAHDAPTYERCMSGAQSTLWRLALLNSDKAVSLWRMWPEPPAALGESIANQRERVGQFERQLASADPGQGVMGAGLMMDSTAANQQAAKGDYGVVSNLAWLLNRYGERAEALKVVDQAMANFRQGSQDSRAISSFFYFVRQLPNIDSDRYLQALSALVPALSNQTGPNLGGTMTVGSQTLQLTAAEAGVIELCQSLHGRPDLVMKTLDTVPGLKSRLDGTGGIDHIIGLSVPMDPSRSPVSMSYSIDGINRMIFSSTVGSISTSIAGPANPLAAKESGILLYKSLHGKLAKDPALVKQKLDDAAKTPEQINALINLANYATNGDADLASLALDSASRMIMQVEPLSERASVMQNLIWAYRQCDDEVDAALLQEGLVIVRQLRDEQKGAAAPMPPASAPVPDRSTMADLLERTIVAEQALDNFDKAMKYLRLMPDDLKLQALLNIVLALTQPL
jgi:hypothetical protein